jgi:hypothetical protein
MNRGSRRFVEHHDLGDEGFDVADVGQSVAFGEGAKVLVQVTPIVGLVITLREDVQKAVVVRLIAMLQRVDDDQAAVGFEYPRALAKNDPADLGRQFMEQKDAGQCVLAFVGRGQRLGVADTKIKS